jgi:protein phosphatase 1 regulatory subunit 7
LRLLDVSNNQISTIANVAHLGELQEFWANDNILENFENLRELAKCPKLGAVYLEANPWSNNPRYVAIVRGYLPALRQIDAAILRWV